MTSQVSQQRSSTSHKSLASMHSMGRLHSFSSEADGDPIIVKMTPRVAVRDKTPHRFQVVPLREITQRPIDGANALALPNIRHNQNRLLGKVGPCNMSSSSHPTPSPSLVGNAHLQFPAHNRIENSLIPPLLDSFSPGFFFETHLRQYFFIGPPTPHRTGPEHGAA